MVRHINDTLMKWTYMVSPPHFPFLWILGFLAFLCLDESIKA